MFNMLCLLEGFRYPAINKPAAVLHWLNHVQTDAEFIIILDADMIMRGPITPWEFGAEKDLVVAAPYEYVFTFLKEPKLPYHPALSIFLFFIISFSFFPFCLQLFNWL